LVFDGERCDTTVDDVGGARSVDQRTDASGELLRRRRIRRRVKPPIDGGRQREGAFG
jgi:hypothetical protein